jgi:hypothetical protein
LTDHDPKSLIDRNGAFRRAERAESIVVGLASTLSRYSGFDPGTLIQVYATDYEKRTSTTTGGPIDGR